MDKRSVSTLGDNCGIVPHPHSHPREYWQPGSGMRCWWQRGEQSYQMLERPLKAWRLEVGPTWCTSGNFSQLPGIWGNGEQTQQIWRNGEQTQQTAFENYTNFANRGKTEKGAQYPQNLARKVSWCSRGQNNALPNCLHLESTLKCAELFEINQMVWCSQWRTRGFPDGSAIKNPPAKAGDTGSIPCGNPLEKKTAIHPVFLFVKSCGQKSLVGYSP